MTSSEISRLVQIRGIIRASGFGPVTDDDIQSAIYAQIMVLEERMDSEMIYDVFEEEDNDYVARAAFNMLDWLRGEYPAPSEEWLYMAGDDDAEPVN